MKKHLAIVSGLGLLFATAVGAQEVSRFTGDIGAGFTTAPGTTGRNLDNPGWNVQGGFGINFSPYVGAQIDLGYNHFDLSSFAVNSIGVPAGDVQIFSATLDPVVHLNPHGHFDVYLTGGGGLYHWYQEFTQPSATTVLGFDPFFGFYPAVVPVNQILGSYTVNKPGVDGGLGIAFGTRFHGKFFAEAKYNRIFFNSGHADYIPVTFGFRW